MKRFSDRIGVTSPRTTIQREIVPHRMRSKLWNLLIEEAWEPVTYGAIFGRAKHCSNYPLLKSIWHSYLSAPIDNIPSKYEEAIKQLRNLYFDAEWYEALNFIEFMANSFTTENPRRFFRNKVNRVLKEEVSAYRFVDEKLVELTSEEEITSIEDAISKPTGYSGVQAHIKAALTLMADRESPDYRNSIKESISAVESLAMKITGKDKATLAEGLKVLEKHHGLHPALKEAFTKMYGYTSDKKGIRHALLDEQDLDIDDAKYMLVTCSAFINYLIGKNSA